MAFLYRGKDARTRKKRWRAIVYWEGRQFFLGYFLTAEEAERMECQFLEELIYR